MDERPRRPSGVLSPFFTRVTCILFPGGGFVLGASGPRGSIRFLTPRVPATPQFIQRTLHAQHAPSFRFALGMGFDPPRYLRGGLVHCAGIGLINKILGQLRFQWKTRVVKGDVDGAIAEIFCSMCVFHSGNLFQSPQAIRRAPRRAASDDPKHRVRKQANSIKRSIKRGAR